MKVCVCEGVIDCTGFLLVMISHFRTFPAFVITLCQPQSIQSLFAQIFSILRVRLDTVMQYLMVWLDCTVCPVCLLPVAHMRYIVKCPISADIEL